MRVRFPVRVKSVFSAGVPLYAVEMRFAWSDHTEVADELPVFYKEEVEHENSLMRNMPSSSS